MRFYFLADFINVSLKGTVTQDFPHFFVLVFRFREDIRTKRGHAENFEGFSQILMEKSDKKKLLGCINTPISNYLKI